MLDYFCFIFLFGFQYNYLFQFDVAIGTFGLDNVGKTITFRASKFLYLWLENNIKTKTQILLFVIKYDWNTISIHTFFVSVKKYWNYVVIVNIYADSEKIFCFPCRTQFVFMANSNVTVNKNWKKLGKENKSGIKKIYYRNKITRIMTKNVSNHEVNVEKWKFEGDT